MATTTYDSPVKRQSYSGIYWSIAIAVVVILAFAWAMRPATRDSISPATSQTATTPTDSTMMNNNMAMDSVTTSTTTTTTDGTTMTNGAGQIDTSTTTINSNTTSPATNAND